MNHSRCREGIGQMITKMNLRQKHLLAFDVLCDVIEVIYAEFFGILLEYLLPTSGYKLVKSE